MGGLTKSYRHPSQRRIRKLLFVPQERLELRSACQQLALQLLFGLCLGYLSEDVSLKGEGGHLPNYLPNFFVSRLLCFHKFKKLNLRPRKKHVRERGVLDRS